MELSKQEFIEILDARFKANNIELKTEVVRKKSQEEIEKTIRNDLNLLKNNEVALILPSPTKIPSSISPTPLPNWRQWWQLFFKKD